MSYTDTAIIRKLLFSWWGWRQLGKGLLINLQINVQREKSAITVGNSTGEPD